MNREILETKIKPSKGNDRILLSDLPKSYCCGCPTESVDWNRKGGLINFNLPCNPAKSIIPLSGWYIDQETETIFIPEMSMIIPSFICLLPIFWIHMCMFMIIGFNAQAIFLYHDENNQFRLEFRVKSVWNESINFYRKNITHAEIETESATMWKSEKIRLALYNSNGMPPDKTTWIKSDGTGETRQKLEYLVAEINKRALRFSNATISTVNPFPGPISPSAPSSLDSYANVKDEFTDDCSSMNQINIPIAQAVIVQEINR